MLALSICKKLNLQRAEWLEDCWCCWGYRSSPCVILVVQQPTGRMGVQVYRGVQGVLDAFPAIGLAGRRFRVRRTRWGADPLFRGSYSYCPADGRAADMDALAAPVVPELNPDPGCEGGAAAPGNAALPRVMFAGEATHRSYFGTVHGAFFSVRAHVDLLMCEMMGFLSVSYLPWHSTG